MDNKKFISLLCLVLFAGTLAEKDELSWEKENALQGLIDIDEDQGMYEGSGGDQMNDDDDLYDYSGMEDKYKDGKMDAEDDEDESEDSMGSADMEDTTSLCKKLQMQIESRKMQNAYVPKCTDEGLFQTVQCLDSYAECWCVDEYGREIVGTKRGRPSKGERKVMCDEMFEEIPVIEEPKKKAGVKSRPGEDKEDTDSDQEYFDQDVKNEINNMNGGVDVQTIEPGTDLNNMVMAKSQADEYEDQNVVMSQPGLLAAIIGGTVVGLLCAVLLVMFIVYRMRKKDEGSYALDEPKRSPSHHQYQRASNREFYA